MEGFNIGCTIAYGVTAKDTLSMVGLVYVAITMLIGPNRVASVCGIMISPPCRICHGRTFQPHTLWKMGKSNETARFKIEDESEMAEIMGGEGDALRRLPKGPHYGLTGGRRHSGAARGGAEALKSPSCTTFSSSKFSSNNLLHISTFYSF
jgi:hypothetical protein